MLFYLTKYLELIFLLIMSSMILGSGISLMIKIRDQVELATNDHTTMWMVPVCIVLCVFNLFY